MTTNGIKQKAQESLEKSSQVATVEKSNDKVIQIKNLLERMKPQLQAAMIKRISPEYLISTAVTVLRMNPKLQECTSISIIGGIFQSAQIGLRLDSALRHASLVPRYNGKTKKLEAQFMPEYRGYMELARRSGEIINLTAQLVRQGDEFSYEYGTNEHLRHRPAKDKAGDVTHVYAYAKLRSGGFLFEVMTKDEVEAIRMRSAAKDEGPWKTDWNEMARKTAVRRLAKYLPLTVEFAKAVQLDEAINTGEDQPLEIIDKAIIQDISTALGNGEEKKTEEDHSKDESIEQTQSEPIASELAIGVKETDLLFKLIENAKSMASLKAIAKKREGMFSQGEITEVQNQEVLNIFNARLEEFQAK